MNAGLPIVEILLKSTVLFGLGILVVRILRTRSSSERHLVLLLTVTGALCLLPMSLWKVQVPGIHVSLPAYSSAVRSLAPAAPPIGLSMSRQEQGVQPTGRRIESPATVPRTPGIDWPVLLSTSYLGIALLIGMFFLFQHRSLSRRLRKLRPIQDADVLREVEEARLTLGISRSVHALAGPTDSSPWTWGAAAPAVVLPSDFSLWPDHERRNALVHEVAHVRRWDHVTSMLVRIACVLYWAHPAVWYIARRVRVEAEKACDDHVLQEGASGPVYASQLLAFARRTLPARTSCMDGTAMANRSSLPTRIRSILDPATRRLPMNRAGLGVTLTTALAIVLPIAILHSQEPEPTEPLAEFSDPRFWEIVQAGARNSEELRQVVTAYAANDHTEEAVNALAAYLQRDDKSADPYCAYCVAVLSTAEREDEDPLIGLFFDATDVVLEQSMELDSGDNLVRLALTTALSRNQANWNRGFYYMSAAAQFGISDPMKLEVVRFLAETGRHADALELATALYGDQHSVHYRSAGVDAWINFLNLEIERHERISNVILSRVRN